MPIPLNCYLKKAKHNIKTRVKTFFLNNNEFIIKDTEEEVELPSFVEN